MIGKISISEKGEELSKFSSVWALVAGYIYSIVGLGLILPALVLTISAHHSMLGFSRDESWRRGFGLIGMPLGFMVVPSQNDLVFVVMLFAAAMSLVGQGVLYASRGGLGIGTAKESSEVIREDIGLKKTDESGGAPAEEAQEEKMDIEPDADEAEAEEEERAKKAEEEEEEVLARPPIQHHCHPRIQHHCHPPIQHHCHPPVQLTVGKAGSHTNHCGPTIDSTVPGRWPRAPSSTPRCVAARW